LLVLVQREIIVFIVEDFNQSLSDEVHFLDVTFITDDHSVWRVYSAVHADDQLVGEATFAFIKEMVERLFEISEHTSILNQFCLHFWSDLLEEWELFDDQIEIV